MNWKRNACSVMLWAVYLLAGSTALLYYTYIDISGKAYDDTTSLLASVCLLVFAAGLAALLRFLFLQIAAAYDRKKRAVSSAEEREESESRKHLCMALLEGVLFVLLLAGGLVLRMIAFPSSAVNSPYFQQAMVEEGRIMSYPVHGLTCVYLHLLHLLFFVVGNQWQAGIWLQILLQLSGAVVLFAALRKLSGRIAALVCLGLQMLLTVSIDAAVTYSPRMLYQLCYALALYAIAVCLKSHGEMQQKKCMVTVGLAGILLAAVCWMDIAGLSLLPLFFSITRLRVKEQYGNAVRVIAAIMLFIVLFLLGFAGMISIYSYASGNELLESLEMWIRQYLLSEVQLIQLTQGDKRLTMLLLCGQIYTAVVYWLQGKQDRISPWFGCLIVCIVLWRILPGETAVMIKGLSMCGALLLVLIGLVETFRKKTGEQAEWISDQSLEQSSGQAPEAASSDVGADLKEEETMEKAEKEVVRKTKQIANPLPLPKKTVRRTAEFAIEVSEEMMHYDVAVAEDDDFDHKE